MNVICMKKFNSTKFDTSLYDLVLHRNCWYFFGSVWFYFATFWSSLVPFGSAWFFWFFGLNMLESLKLSLADSLNKVDTKKSSAAKNH